MRVWVAPAGRAAAGRRIRVGAVRADMAETVAESNRRGTAEHRRRVLAGRPEGSLTASLRRL
jgi:hypothetical protein